MKTRYPKIDFSQVKPHWAPVIEFAQRANGSGLIPTYVEPYLVKIMLIAKPLIDPKDTELHEEVKVFIKQEAQHCKQHNLFNVCLRNAGYEGLKAHEDKLAADLEDFLANKSLKFNLAYADGFESLGALGASMWFDTYAEYLEGADQNVIDLWKWHMAEEYEHREVAFKVYHALYGKKSLWDAWIYRVYGYVFAVKHLMGFGTKVGDYLLGVDRAKMTPEELAASIGREKTFKKKMGKAALPHLLKVLSPFYNPKYRIAPKENVDAYLKRWETVEA